MRGWSLRTAVVMEPTEANGGIFDTRLGKNCGVAVEWEKRYKPMGHAGALRVLGFQNRERAGTFRNAILPDGSTDLASTRRPGTKKYGFGLNAEQEITPDIGAFAHANTRRGLRQVARPIGRQERANRACIDWVLSQLRLYPFLLPGPASYRAKRPIGSRTISHPRGGLRRTNIANPPGYLRVPVLRFAQL